MRPRHFAAAALALLAAALPAHAQTQWLDRDARRSLRIDARATGLRDHDSTFPTGALVLTGRFPIGRGAWFVGELPYAGAGVSEDRYYLPVSYGGTGARSDHQSTLGNPYLGVEFADHGNGMHYEAGLRPSVAAHDRPLARQAGFGSGIDHEHAFLDRVVSMRVAADYHHAATALRPVGFDVRVAPLLQFDQRPAGDVVAVPQGPAYDQQTFEALDARPELFVDYDAQFRFEGPRARLLVGYAGRTLVSRTRNTFAENSVHEITLGIEIEDGLLRPGLLAVLPVARDADSVQQAGVAFTLAADLSGRPASGVWAARGAPGAP